jgi:hypothetical protein
LQEDRVSDGIVLGDIDAGEELGPVTHGDAVFMLGVVGLDVLQALGFDLHLLKI